MQQSHQQQHFSLNPHPSRDPTPLIPLPPPPSRTRSAAYTSPTILSATESFLDLINAEKAKAAQPYKHQIERLQVQCSLYEQQIARMHGERTKIGNYRKEDATSGAQPGGEGKQLTGINAGTESTAGSASADTGGGGGPPPSATLTSASSAFSSSTLSATTERQSPGTSHARSLSHPTTLTGSGWQPSQPSSSSSSSFHSLGYSMQSVTSSSSLAGALGGPIPGPSRAPGADLTPAASPSVPFPVPIPDNDLIILRELNDQLHHLGFMVRLNRVSSGSGDTSVPLPLLSNQAEAAVSNDAGAARSGKPQIRFAVYPNSTWVKAYNDMNTSLKTIKEAAPASTPTTTVDADSALNLASPPLQTPQTPALATPALPTLVEFLQTLNEHIELSNQYIQSLEHKLAHSRRLTGEPEDGVEGDEAEKEGISGTNTAEAALPNFPNLNISPNLRPAPGGPGMAGAGLRKGPGEGERERKGARNSESESEEDAMQVDEDLGNVSPVASVSSRRPAPTPAGS